jgi:hypothetical protein
MLSRLETMVLMAGMELPEYLGKDTAKAGEAVAEKKA